jgi:anti-sigma B factor antagonist
VAQFDNGDEVHFDVGPKKIEHRDVPSLPFKRPENAPKADSHALPGKVQADAPEIDVDFGATEEVHFDVHVKTAKQSGMHPVMPISAVFFSQSMDEQVQTAHKSLDPAISMASVSDTRHSQSYSAENSSRQTIINSDGPAHVPPRHETGAIDVTKKSSNEEFAEKRLGNRQGETVSGERAAIESIRNAMSESNFFPPDDESSDELLDETGPHDLAEMRERLDKAHAALRDITGNRPTQPNQAQWKNDDTTVLPVKKKIEESPFTGALRQKNPGVREVHADGFKASIVEMATHSNSIVISLQGRIEQDQQKSLEEFFDRFVIQDGQNIICNMAGLISISSSGWGVLVAQLQRLRKHGGKLFLCAMRGEVDQCFRVLELDKLFIVFPSVPEALRRTERERDMSVEARKTKTPWTVEKTADKASLSLEEKIRSIISDNPDLGMGQISKLLKSDEYGNVKINFWTLNAKLRSMNLSTKEERYRFFRSA